MFYTVNKPLVPEWPCIIEVSYIYSSYMYLFFLLDQLEEVGGVLKISVLFYLNGTRFASCHFSDKKVSIYRAPLAMVLEVDLSASKS